VRFCQEITQTDRADGDQSRDHSTIALFDNTVLDNPLSPTSLIFVRSAR